jgi:hypothetical protein
MKNSSVIKKKLAAYSTIAAATLAVTDSKAQIIYSDPPDIIIDNFYLLDLNNDGIYDFKFFHGANDYFVFYGNNDNDQILEGDDCNFYLHPPRIIPEGVVIKRTPFDWTPLEQFSSAGFFCAPPGGSCDDVPWPGKEMKFFGFRFKDHHLQSKYNYGWIRVSVPDDCHNIKIHDWAYNSVAGASIVAGQTQRTASDELMDPGNDLLVYSNAKTLFINNNIDEELLKVSITSLSGQMLREISTSQESTELDLHSFPAGMLLVTIKGDHTSHSWKIVAE